MSRMMFFRPAAAILLIFAAGCSDQPLPTPPANTDIQASPTPPKAGRAGKSVKEDVRAPGPSTTMEPG
jgi:hypothetical protein